MSENSRLILERRRFLSLAAAATTGACLSPGDEQAASAAEDGSDAGTGLQPNHLYWMPIHFGPRLAAEPARTRKYEDATIFVVPYITSSKAVETLRLPPCFTVPEPPIITVKYCSFSGVDFLAGGSYNLVSVNIAVVFQGREDNGLAGDYCLVIWENSFLPILLGREILGAPKIYADTVDHRSLANEKRWVASENGYPLCEGVLSGLKQLPDSTAKEIEEQPPRAWMGWKYIPSINRAGFDVSYPTLLPSFQVDNLKAWAGKGHVRFFARSFEESPVGYMAASALSRLPVVEKKDALMLTATMTMMADDCKPLK